MIFEHRSAVDRLVNEQWSTENRGFMRCIVEMSTDPSVFIQKFSSALKHYSEFIALYLKQQVEFATQQALGTTRDDMTYTFIKHLDLDSKINLSIQNDIFLLRMIYPLPSQENKISFY